MAHDAVNVDELEQPIALRRSKRRSGAISPAKPTAIGSAKDAGDDTEPRTPSKARSKKRVRFSAPGPLGIASSAGSSGLTPHVGRVTLTTPRRRASTPARRTTAGPFEIQFTPLRQALDERTKRQIRRNGLSQEINTYDKERRDNAQLERELRAKDQELQKVRRELEAAKSAKADATSHQIVQELSSSQRQVETELEELRQSFDKATTPPGFEQDMNIDWEAVNLHKSGIPTAPAHDGGDTIPTYDHDADMPVPSTPLRKDVNVASREHPDTGLDEELLAMALDLESAKREKRRLFNDLRSHLPRSTGSDPSLGLEGSPDRGAHGRPKQQQQQQHHRKDPLCDTSTSSVDSPPKTFYADLSKALRSTTHRAETAELALHALELDIRALGFSPADESSTASILENIRGHFRQARLDLERALPGETVSGLGEPGKVLPEAISKLKLLSCRVQEREAEMRSMHEQQRTLKGNFECGLRAAEKANQRIKELEEAVEEGADELLSMRMRLQANEKEGAEKDHTITSLIAALDKYRADVARLEVLVVQVEHEQGFKLQEGLDESGQKMEELEAKVAAEETGRRKAEESAVGRLAKITALQAALDAANDDASSLQIQLSTLEAQKSAESASVLTRSRAQEHQHELAIQNLNTRLSNLSTALATSQSECTRLDRLVAKLRSRLAISEEASTHAVEDLWQEVVRGVTKSSEIRKSHIRGCKVRGANWAMEDEDEEAEAESAGGGGGGGNNGGAGEREPMTPVSLVRFVDVETDANMGADADADADVHGEGDVEGRVEMARGRWRSRSATSMRRSRTGLGIQMSMTKRDNGRRHNGRARLDSGIGMGCLSEEDEDVGGGEAGIGDEGLGTEIETETLSSDAIVLPSSETGFEIHVDASETVLPSVELQTKE